MGNKYDLVIYRILCPDKVIGSVIGKSGKVINAIRKETRAKIKVVETLYAAEDALLKVDGAISNSIVSSADFDKRQKVTWKNAKFLSQLASKCANIIGEAGSIIKKVAKQNQSKYLD
ncbi:hypothetical protein ACFE04_004601 [Oxalis oulophora]